MIIYCVSCREPCLETSEKFIPGSEYTGEMFQSYKNDHAYAADFNFEAWETEGNLWCPRCEQNFIQDGEILTEHGRIKKGQGKINTSMSAIHEEGDLKGMLKSPNLYNHPKELFVCEVCGAEFDHKIALIGHMRSHK